MGEIIIYFSNLGSNTCFT